MTPGLHYCSSETAPMSTRYAARDFRTRAWTSQLAHGSTAASSRSSSAPAPPSPGTTTNAYIQNVIAAGGFGRYERNHLDALAATFAPHFSHLPPEIVRLVVEYAFHAGYY